MFSYTEPWNIAKGQNSIAWVNAVRNSEIEVVTAREICQLSAVSGQEIFCGRVVIDSWLYLNEEVGAAVR